VIFRWGEREALDIHILTFCRRLDLFYGTTLIFKTLRRGSPVARVFVTDNASLPEAKPEIKRLAHETDCHYQQLAPPEIEHGRFIHAKILARSKNKKSDQTLVFLDSKLVVASDRGKWHVELPESSRVAPPPRWS
jgi:hypothetical protein